MVDTCEAPVQLPLIHVVESDDLYLEAHADVLWFEILRDLDWRPFLDVGAQYYEALWEFNQAQREARLAKAEEEARANPETRQEADRRLLFARATLDEAAPVLHETQVADRDLHHVDAAKLRPGQVPKGRVERDIRYARGRFFRGRDYPSFEEAQAKLADWRDNVANVRLHGTTQRRPVDAFFEEREHLLPLPAEDYEIAIWGNHRVRKDCHIQVASNFYSVPYTFVGEHVFVRITDTHVSAFARGEEIARHERVQGRGRTITDVTHYPPEKRLAATGARGPVPQARGASPRNWAPGLPSGSDLQKDRYTLQAARRASGSATWPRPWRPRRDEGGGRGGEGSRDAGDGGVVGGRRALCPDGEHAPGAGGRGARGVMTHASVGCGNVFRVNDLRQAQNLSRRQLPGIAPRAEPIPSRRASQGGPDCAGAPTCPPVARGSSG